MKKLQMLFIGIVVLIIALYFGSAHIEKTEGYTAGKTITIYNWGDYIDPDLITKFEKETGYKVVYETFDSNEAMYTKVKQGGTAYDITIPSDYMIEKMKKQHMLKTLDHSKIKGLSNIDPQFMNQVFDKGNRYSVPYFWGTLGIIYNDKYIQKNQIQHWEDLWNPAFKDQEMLIDGAREIMGIALTTAGKSVNSKNVADLNKAAAHLTSLAPNVKAVVADEIKMYMINEESSLAVTYSGEASEMLSENSHLHYVIPEEGSNLWFDNIVIPKTSKNTKGAYAFINFMLEPKNAAQNAEYIGYATPNAKAKALLPKKITADQQFYPSEKTMKNLEVYQDLGQKYLGIYNDLFLEFKMYRK